MIFNSHLLKLYNLFIMSISNEIKNLEEIAMIKLSEQEKKKFIEDLSVFKKSLVAFEKIIDFNKKFENREFINEINVSDLRDDVEENLSQADLKILYKNSKNFKNNLFVIKKKD
ncbi:/ / hypothetical protein / 113550:113891 Forward [Candidatus Hepatoplasma crinochetorum]|uniref:Glutamyl-tRNA(Gln) amidotransferase subunit C n=1 Tax=Candidatus Hepatoplasma crinochetorum TaxID=295596 RepID=A0A0G7ZNF3_9MOLU|nr:/ / hypothetical protein / 113550:113891 Forward [Candidatus Hepatoplasma crinochetorum]